MKKVLCIFLAIVLLFLSSCNKSDLEADEENNSQSNSDSTAVEIEDTYADAPEIDDATSITYIREEELCKPWDLQLFLDICKCYTSSCRDRNFSSDETILYSNVFSYFIHVGCTNTYLKALRPEVLTYYDEETLTLTVPCEIADEYLTRKFNTQVDRESIEYYDPETECYVFQRSASEFYYDQELLITDFDFYENIYTLDIALRHSFDNELRQLPQRTRFSIKLGENCEYRFVSVETIAATVISDDDSDAFMMYDSGRVQSSAEDTLSEADMGWWLVEVPGKSSVYTIRPVYDGTYGISLNDSNDIVINKLGNWASVSGDNYLKFQFEIISFENDTYTIRSLYNGKYLSITENDVILSDEQSFLSLHTH